MDPKSARNIWAGSGPLPSELNILFVLISLCSRDSLPYARGVAIHWREKGSRQARKTEKRKSDWNSPAAPAAPAGVCQVKNPLKIKMQKWRKSVCNVPSSALLIPCRRNKRCGNPRRRGSGNLPWPSATGSGFDLWHFWLVEWLGKLPVSSREEVLVARQEKEWATNTYYTNIYERRNWKKRFRILHRGNWVARKCNSENERGNVSGNWR